MVSYKKSGTKSIWGRCPWQRYRRRLRGQIQVLKDFYHHLTFYDCRNDLELPTAATGLNINIEHSFEQLSPSHALSLGSWVIGSNLGPLAFQWWSRHHL